MAKHLRFDLILASYNKLTQNHPIEAMKEHGITYQHATPQSLGNCWWFWNCENIPSPLPEFLEVVDLNPMEAIGFGLSKEMAEKIRDYKKDESQ